MAVATWRILAFGALLASVSFSASAQMVVGGSGQPSVEVNWGVLDSLGRQPTLADMLKGQPPQGSAPAASGKAAAGPAAGVKFQPYKPQASTAKPAKAKVKAEAPKKKPAVVPASAKASDSLAESPAAKLVQASQKQETTAAKVATGPVVSLPEVPAPVAAPKAEAPKPEPVAAVAPAPAAVPVPVPVPAVVPAPVQASASAVPVPAAVPAPTVVAAPAPVTPAPVTPASIASAAATLPPTALTPPPLPAPAPQVASLPPVPAALPQAGAKGGDALSLVFGADDSALPGGAQTQLDRLVTRMRKDENIGLQLLAYAEGDSSDPSKARRLSLSRALEVRKYLMDQGIRSTRIEVRALGNKIDGNGPSDRVDAVVVTR